MGTCVSNLVKTQKKHKEAKPEIDDEGGTKKDKKEEKRRDKTEKFESVEAKRKHRKEKKKILNRWKNGQGHKIRLQLTQIRGMERKRKSQRLRRQKGHHGKGEYDSIY